MQVKPRELRIRKLDCEQFLVPVSRFGFPRSASNLNSRRQRGSYIFERQIRSGQGLAEAVKAYGHKTALE